MRKGVGALILLTLMTVAAPDVWAACNTIQSGLVKYGSGLLAGTSLKPGFDAWGYNYQAHLFNGSYFNVYARGDGFPPYEGDDDAYLTANPSVVGHWAWEYRTTTVNMKWNDAWISNKDCSGDGLLDRHYGFTSYIGSGAWETNHQSDTYELDGHTIHWTYFVKIVAVPESATNTGGTWSLGDDVIGPDIWGEFATIQEVYNDPGAGAHGLLYKSPTSPGFGYWGNQP